MKDLTVSDVVSWARETGAFTKSDLIQIQNNELTGKTLLQIRQNVNIQPKLKKRLEEKLLKPINRGKDFELLTSC